MKLRFQSTNEEKRIMTIKIKSLIRSIKKQRDNNDKLEEKNNNLETTVKKQNKKISELEKENEKLKRNCDIYKNMIFKANKKNKKEKSDNLKKDEKQEHKEKKQKAKRGGKEGHKGTGKKKPDEIDIVRKVHMNKCPTCSSKLTRTNTYQKHTVEDIPDFSKMRPDVIEYQMEEQWCSCCKKKIISRPEYVIPNSRYGINIITYIMLQKYGAKISVNSIAFNLKEIFGIKITEGGIMGILRKVSKHLGSKYEEILNKIKVSPVKFADETGHRTNGINGWLWGFFTDKEAYYKKIFKDVDKEDVLVRDDYGGYKKLPMQHQTCWSHLLRFSHEIAYYEKASNEAMILHNYLDNMFNELKEIIESNFIKQKRKVFYNLYSDKIKKIIEKEYLYDDTKRIQTRIKNQNINLITAINYENVPLTNNLSERMIRPVVVCRKISGGSRSKEGAKTFAVNMSIFQTIKMNNKPLLSELKNYIWNENY